MTLSIYLPLGSCLLKLLYIHFNLQISIPNLRMSFFLTTSCVQLSIGFVAIHFAGLRQFLATKNPSVMMKNSFHFVWKAVLVLLKISTFLSRHFGNVAAKRLKKKAKVNFKISDVKEETANNYNTHIAQYLQKKLIKQWNLVSQ